MRGSKKINSYSLSPMQQGMLFHYLTDPTSGTDIDQIVCHSKEKIDVKILENTWNEVIANYDACRTSFIWEEVEQPTQIVNGSTSIEIKTYEWSNSNDSEKQSRLFQFLKDDRAAGIDLSKSPLMRLSLIKINDGENILIWTFHHIILDGRSHSIILNDVFSLYDSYSGGQKYKLPKVPPYRKFVEWISNQDFKKDETFWREFLRGIKSPTTLKSNSIESNSIPSKGMNERELIIDEEQSEALRSLAKNSEVTLNTIVQSAWGLLLGRYTGESDILFGAVRAGRYGTIDNADSAPGLFMNTLPMRIKIEYEKTVTEWLKEIREKQIELRDHEHTPLVYVIRWSEIPRGTQMFQSVLIFDNYDLTLKFREKGGNWKNREFRLFEKTGYPLTVYVYADKKIKIKVAFDPNIFMEKDIDAILTHFKNILIGMNEYKDGKVYEIPFLTEPEIQKIFHNWNNTKVEYNPDKCIHQIFEEQAEKTPEATAVFCNGKSMTYKMLNQRANQLANKFRKMGARVESLVGIQLHRSVDMAVAILATLKAGGAYVPLDPEFPKDRIAYMVQDSKCAVIITETSLKQELVKVGKKIILIDSEWEAISKESSDNINSEVTSKNLAYVIYTSGSTGNPKGVMVQHYNVVNFFTGMEKHISYDPPGTWLAVTSLSFDISVLELLWTLCRGFKVVIFAEQEWRTKQINSGTQSPSKKVEFSLFYFSSYASENEDDKYRLLLEGAKFADQNRFAAVWTPERHFHDFGGLYPNPAVTSAAVAAITKYVRIMSGSVVSPLHSPIRIAEEWSVVDNLSHGRVGISFAAGWQPNDFIIMPQNYQRRKDIMFEQIEVVRKLWRGEAIEFESPTGKKVDLKTLPKPIQKELPVWITVAGNPETFQMAGERGFNILTHLLGQSIEDLKDKIEIYRKAWKENGHGSGNGHVSLMLHTFVGENIEEVKATVREPMKQYLKSAMSLVQMASWYFPVYSHGTTDIAEAAANLTEEDKEAILNHSFERYFETSALMGTPETCLETVNKIKNVGVDEVSCLVDFGVPSEKVLSHLQYLNAVKTLANLGIKDEQPEEEAKYYTIPELIDEHKVTHMQCTPSMARMLLMDKQSKSMLKNLKYMLIGGEAFPVSLADELLDTVNGKILNMYGPTETTIWSTVHELNGKADSIPIGKPIANTEILLLDKYQQLAPIGVPGELCIGGDGVVRGYFGRPELTSEKFIQYSNNGYNKKIYRTGDLALYREDGVIEFLGRLDFQVKIRGYRIELGEIETVLEKHPQIGQAVVVAREDIPGEKRLVAYIVSTKSSNPSTADLRNYLLEKLPEYMLPAVFVFMDKLPTTPNGKVDRNALPSPEAERPNLVKEFIAPVSATEKKLAEIWSQVLTIETIGLNDNFFELGGHSLSAVQTVVTIHQAFHIDLSLQNFFQSTTLAELAEAVDSIVLEKVSDDKLERLLSEVENSK